MSNSHRAARRTEEPVRSPPSELAVLPRPLVRRLGRLRVPVSLTHRPWATAYRLPSGKTIWCLRLRQDGRIVRTVVPTRVLRRYAYDSGLRSLVVAIDRIVAAGDD